MVSLDSLTTVGNFVVAVVALFVAFWPMLWKWLRRPKVEMVFDEIDPFVKHITYGSVKGQEYLAGTEAFWVRVKVINNGRSVARNCKGKLVSITPKNGTGAEPRDFSAVQLRWLNEKKDLLDINPSEYEWLSLIFLNENQKPGGMYNIGAIMDRTWEAVATTRKKEEQPLLKVVIYGKNFDPATASFQVKFPEQMRWDSCTVTKIEARPSK